MTYAEAKKTALKLFGPETTLKRTDNARRCLVLSPTGTPVGDGRSWLEALRSAGTYYIMKDEVRKAEAARFKTLFEEYTKETGYDPEKMNETQMAHFDAWMAAKEKGVPTPPAPAVEPEKALVTLK